MDPSGIPQVVWMLWLQGWDTAPPLVVACRDSWISRNPGWDVRQLDAEAIRTLVPELPTQGEMTAAHYADRVRLKLLLRHGGVWVDATTYCHVPLDEWLHPRSYSGFFAFSAPTPGRMISNWFLASTPASLIVSRWDAAADEYWTGRTRPDSYFWMHQLFGDLCRKDPEFAANWRRTPSLPADGPHYFVPYRRRLTRPMSRRMQARLASRCDPVYKLTHRVSARMQPDSAYAYFLHGERTLCQTDARLAKADRGLEKARWFGRDLAQTARAGVKVALRRAPVRGFKSFAKSTKPTGLLPRPTIWMADRSPRFTSVGISRLARGEVLRALRGRQEMRSWLFSHGRGGSDGLDPSSTLTSPCEPETRPTRLGERGREDPAAPSVPAPRRPPSSQPTTHHASGLPPRPTGP